MIISPARAMYHYPTREDNLLVCDSYIDASYMIAFFYPIVLIVVCTVYAILTRKIPEAFNESKHIGSCTSLYTLAQMSSCVRLSIYIESNLNKISTFAYFLYIRV